jgi:hypothetical protein
MKALGIILILVGLPLLFVPIIGIPVIIIGIIIILSSIGKGNAKKTGEVVAAAMAEQLSRQNNSSAPYGADREKWNALIRYDEDVSAAVEKLEPYGPAAIEKLRVVYGALNDKSKLERMVSDIEREFSAQK